MVVIFGAMSTIVRTERSELRRNITRARPCVQTNYTLPATAYSSGCGCSCDRCAVPCGMARWWRKQFGMSILGVLTRSRLERLRN